MQHDTQKPNKKVLSLWVPTTLVDDLSRLSIQTGRKKGEIAAEALQQYLTKTLNPNNPQQTLNNPQLKPEVQLLHQQMLAHLEEDLQSSHNLLVSAKSNTAYQTSEKMGGRGTFSEELEHNLLTLFPLHEEYMIDVRLLQAEALERYHDKGNTPPDYSHVVDEDQSPVIDASEPLNANGDGTNDETDPDPDPDTPEDALTQLTSLGPPSTDVDPDELDDFKF